jgi:hypothetical protein
MTATQASSAQAPVINFAGRTDDRKKTRRQGQRRLPAVVSDHPDSILITACIEYAMQIRAAQVTYEIDPTDSEFAAFMDPAAQGKARARLAVIMNNKPTTMDGLRAKAALMPIILEDWSGDLDKIEIGFLTSVTDDVVRFQKAACRMNQSDTVIAEMA